jgi:ABC-2 type transport system permease protein
MRALIVARKSLLEMVRELQLLGLIVLLPLIFLVITAVSYSDPFLATHPVWVISPDPGNAGLVAALESQQYANGQPIFDVTLTTDQVAAEKALKEQTVTALALIAPDATGALSVTLRGDALYMPFYKASTIMGRVIQEYADSAAGLPRIVQINEEPLSAASPRNWFDWYVPGNTVFALMLIIPQTAMLVAREIRWNTLRRLRITRLRAWDLLAGISLAQMIVAVFQVVIMFIGALALGFHNQGSLLLAVFVGLAICFSAVGQGLIVACFVENDSQAANLGATVAMFQVFLSGSMYPLPPLTLFTLVGHQSDLFDIFPSTHGFLALQQVVNYGMGLREVGFRLGATLLLSVLYFAVGVLIFQRLQMRSEKIEGSA